MTQPSLNDLPAEAFCEPDQFRTAFDTPGRSDERYQYGMKLGREQAREITIAINGAWGATMKTGGSLSAAERIGLHADTAALLRGFLDSGCALTVYRMRDGAVVPTLISGTPDLTDEQKTEIADQAFERYDFSGGQDDGTVAMESDSGWDREDPDDWIKKVYVRYPDDDESADSHLVSFHVKFEKGQFAEAYALDCDSGNEIGCMPPEAPSNAASRPASCGM